MSPPRNEAERLRRDLLGLVVLESAQRTIAIGALVAVAVRAVLLAEDRPTAIAITAVVFLALVYLALAFRVRMGQELLRRQLLEIELREGNTEPPSRSHPYRVALAPGFARNRHAGRERAV